MPQSAFLTFSLDSMDIHSLRSGSGFLALGRDTDYVVVSAQPANELQIVVNKSLGDVGKGTHQVQASTGPVLMTVGGPISFQYVVTNNGHASAADVDTALTKGISEVASAGIQALVKYLGSALGVTGGATTGGVVAGGAATGAATGATLGSVVLPVVGTILGVVAGYFAGLGLSVLTADCDGLVASEQVLEDFNVLWAFTKGGSTVSMTTNHQAPQDNSPHGCGDPSDYVTTWTLTIYWFMRSDDVGTLRTTARNENHLDVFWVNPNGSVESAWWDVNAPNAAWSPPFPIAPAGTVNAGHGVCSLLRLTNHMDVFWVGQDGSIGSVWWDANANNGLWNPEFRIAPPDSGVAGTIAACARTATHMDVFWVHSDGSIETAWWDQNANNAAWNAPFPITPASVSNLLAPSVINRTSTSIDLFWVAPDGSVRTVYWNAYLNYGNWNPVLTLSPPNSALATKVAVISRLTTCMDIFWVAPDGSVLSAWWNADVNNAAWNGEFNVAPPGSAATNAWQTSPGGLVTAIGRTPTHMDVFWVGPDGSIRSAWWDQAINNAAWNPVFNVAPPNSAAAGAQIIALCLNNNMVELFWITPEGGVSTTAWDGSVNAWRPVTQLAPNGIAVQGTLSAIARGATSTELVWMSPNGSMQVMGWNLFTNNGKWNSVYQFAPPGSGAVPATQLTQMALV